MIHYLRAAGAALVLDASGPGVPVLVHWGSDLGLLDPADLGTLAASSMPPVGPSSLDVPVRLSLLPTAAEGWSGRPGVGGFRTGVGQNDLSFELMCVRESGENTLAIELVDRNAAVSILIDLELSREGVLRLRNTLTNTGTGSFELAALDVILPVPDRAREILDFTGLWSHERRPQRSLLGQGLWSRESRHGRPGHDDSFLTVVGTPGFGFRQGEVWAVHEAWSGDKRVWGERSALGYAALGAGELLDPGEISLAGGESYSGPWTIAVYSDAGLDGLSARLHPWIRSWSTLSGPRKVVLNTWEAVYFDHDLDTLGRLIDAAATVGVERFVLDDGWFSGRTDDQRALGDWFVDAAKWPSGLHPLIERVHGAGLDFGLWVEPEMVSPESDLARAHPDWLLGSAAAPTWRGQRVLDLANPDAFAYMLERLTALLREYPIAYLKWDHNRDLLGGSVHRQTVALYALMDAVRAAQPGLEIESCASGGGRIDLGILSRVDRVWPSDTNDPLERQQIQRYTGVLIPPEYLGGHLGAALAHTTGRTSALGFRLATALFGSAGIEWDLTVATSAEMSQVRDWITVYKQRRASLHSGVVVHADASDPALELHGVVAQDRSTAIYAQVAVGAPRAALPAPLRFPGLAPERRYRVRQLAVGPAAQTVQTSPPAWLDSAARELILTGAVLGRVGLPAPLITPEQAAVFILEAVF
ncbi:alpha-galactosidase [Cryobacterium roopkundense]|uniref:alpha-galactosidase n=1 Tax=Cryobacterium roopkundense TaxID=1001240 RepID=A0A099J8G0_9MICO|nr:alpha-galactosidase [Cryobacterium roopkundense]KGJ74669.1 alpha-galactosidase [Cryobacterium roopkundense]MBB5640042.1 alpha-galactosidase [Cryobacterium roopkundense]